MGYTERYDKRADDEMRPISAEVGVIQSADGSARFTIGKTIAIAAVRGPRELFPRFLQNPKKAKLRVHYNMMPFSSGDRVRPGGGRRSKEINLVIAKALEPVVNLEDFPNAVVDIFIEFPQTDAGTRCAGISAASMALADAGLSMRDLVSSVSVGKVDKKIVVDLSYDEEAYPDGPVADVPVAFLPNSGEVSLLQMDGEITPAELKKALKMAEKACKKIYTVQKKALKDKFKREVK